MAVAIGYQLQGLSLCIGQTVRRVCHLVQFFDQCFDSFDFVIFKFPVRARATYN